MRNYIAAVATSLIIASSPLALAQQGGQQGKGPKLEKMQQHLGLSDSQVEQIREIKANGGSRADIKAVLTEEQQQKMAEHKKQKQGKEHKLARMQQHLGLSDSQVEQIREIKANGGNREDIMAVLTEEQQQTWAEHRKQMKGKHQGQGQSS